MKESFDHLSAEERAHAGDPEDYDWEHPLEGVRPAPRPRSHFSMRIDPKLYEELSAAASLREVSFSDLVREALETYLGRRRAMIGSEVFTVSRARVIVSDDAQAWSSPTRATEPSSLTTSPEPVLTQ